MCKRQPLALAALLGATITLCVAVCPIHADLFVASYNTDSVKRYDGTTGVFLGDFVTSGSGGLNGPTGVVFGADGNLYVASMYSNRVLRYDGTSGAYIDTFASGSGMNEPFGVVFGPDGNLYVSSMRSCSVLRYDGTTGTFIDAFASGGGLDGPHGLVFGPDGHLYVSGYGNDQVLRYDGSTGASLGVFTSGTAMDRPTGLFFGTDGELYVSDAYHHRVCRFDGTTGAFVGTATSGGGLSIPNGVLDGPDGNLYVGGWGNGAVLRYDAATGAYMDTFTAGGSLNGVTFMTFTNTNPTTLKYGANLPPEADAGGPYRFLAGHSVVLDGSDSSDPDGSIVNWQWDIDGSLGPVETTAIATYTWEQLQSIFGITGTGVYDVRVEVTDDQGLTDWSEVTTLTLVPEPASMGLLALGGLGLVARRRRR